MPNLTMLALPALDPVGSAVPVLSTKLGTAAASFDLPDWTRALLDLQRQIQQSLAHGAVHAVTPGHGKSVVASYFLGQGAAPCRGLTMSAKVIGTHVLSAIVLVLAATFLVDISLGARPADFPMIRLVSYAGVTVIGACLLWRALRGEHVPLTQSPASGQGALPYFAGLSACPLTTIIMAVALANGMATLGLLVSLSMALGMIVTVTLLALTVIMSRRWLLELLARHAAHVDCVARVLEIAGAAAVTLVGLLLLSAELA